MNVIYLSKQKPKFKCTFLQDDIFLCGMKGSGKTTRVKKILDLIRGKYPYWIYSPQRPIENYGDYGKIVKTIEQLDYSQCVYAGETNPEVLAKICKRAFEKFGNIVLVLDDLHESVHKHSVEVELSRLVQSGRNRGISCIYIATNPAVIPNWILGNVSVAFGYRVQLESHCRWLGENYFGEEAWLLVQKDRRKSHFNKPDDFDVLPKYSYIMRHSDEAQTTVIINDLDQKFNTVSEVLEE